VYPLGFTGAEKAALAPGEPVRHRLRQLDGWLDYAVELGCSGLWLVWARTTVQHLSNEAIAFRAAADDAGILVLLNAGDTAFRFPVDVAGFAMAETPDPGAQPDDPALVPGHSWVILGS
jgi:cyclomaltodextrinase